MVHCDNRILGKPTKQLEIGINENFRTNPFEAGSLKTDLKPIISKKGEILKLFCPSEVFVLESRYHAMEIIYKACHAHDVSH